MPLNLVIEPVDRTLEAALQNKIDQKTKPLGALGVLETIALKVGLIQNSLQPTLHKPCVMVFAGDHGVAESGVSAYPQAVTAQMVANFLAGGSAINVFAKQHGMDLVIVDAGVNADLSAHTGLIHAKVALGTRNYLHEMAMTSEQCLTALQRGAELVKAQQLLGCNCIGFGEMGIANTSSASLLMHCLTGQDLHDCVGRGTGLNDAQLARKLKLLEQAIKQYQQLTDPLIVLETFGGFELAMMVGAYLQAAALKKIIIVDGFIATAALLVAYRLKPHVLDYCLFSHVSDELGHGLLLEELQAKPLLNLSLRLGEGSAIALVYPLIASALLFLRDMASFSEAGVSTAE
ncbi:MAG: nicotinate-nucleotide--dimethylbenzimidazole phosphoribosyltransferase [Methylococcaceae bacterium]